MFMFMEMAQFPRLRSLEDQQGIGDKARDTVTFPELPDSHGTAADAAAPTRYRTFSKSKGPFFILVLDRSKEKT
jgi:hypothetical protein